MIRVFVVDDHPLVRIGLRWLLEAQPDIRVIGEAATGDDARILIPSAAPDVVLCDYQLPGDSGLDLTRHLLKHDPKTKILMVSMVDGGPVPRRLLAAGALGYVSKARDGSVVVRAVREVAQGRRFLDDSLGGHILFESSPFERLSGRELEIAMLLIHGKGNREIAKALGVADSTVRTLRSRALAKLEVRGEAALTRLAMKYGLAAGPAKGSD
ncbi:MULTISPECIES: response regulator [Lysobacter]|uniref:response regulator n=1 Tax=Lysobacter TaxID=68 RepID=UPI001F3A6656|nr:MULTISPECIES: response regulator transcription factor [Lysobacter]UJB19222.1 response regulator transcription factor [Lysobacter capsici]UJQ27053.1 response regulator transcription factor [Lysobacter gummosus]